MRIRRRILIALLFTADAASVAGQMPAAPPKEALSYSRFALPNGLVVVVNEDRSSPIVAVDLAYHVGSKDEQPNRRGFAHLCEHLMGLGSPALPGPQKDFLP